MKRDLLSLIAKMENKNKEIDNIRNNENFSEQFKQQKIDKVKEKYQDQMKVFLRLYRGKDQ